MNRMAFIGKVIELNPIEGKDLIGSATVVCGEGGRWHGVVKKSEFKVGDLCHVFLPDSQLPETPDFEFLRPRHFRIRMCKFGGVPSEVLIMPKTVEGEVGTDITAATKTIKYEKPIDASIAGDVLGNFPGFVPKTDEPNFQTVEHLVKALEGKQYYVSVKVDGSSCTFVRYQGQFQACTRNLSMKDSPANSIWNLARKYNLIGNLPEGFAVQAEIIGPKIQGNPMGLKQPDIRVFNLYNINEHRYEDFAALTRFCVDYGLPMVEVVPDAGTFPSNLTDAELQQWAVGTYANGKAREGIVIRSKVEELVDGDRLSFKVINLEYKG
jgi:RNA ligase (TIGR02306 family)